LKPKCLISKEVLFFIMLALQLNFLRAWFTPDLHLHLQVMPSLAFPLTMPLQLPSSAFVWT
jgi:hypothetical protein